MAGIVGGAPLLSPPYNATGPTFASPAESLWNPDRYQAQAPSMTSPIQGGQFSASEFVWLAVAVGVILVGEGWSRGEHPYPLGHMRHGDHRDSDGDGK